MSFGRLAIVNRGEAAMRCLHAVAELQSTRSHPLTSIALYTDPDAGAWFVREADEAVHLGPATYLDPAEGRRKITYLDHDLLLDALVRVGAEAVWVGWGFVAEDAAFAQRCEEAGITFIGPPSAVIRRLGDKVASKRLAEGADVPVVPWSGGPVEDVDAALEQADRLGYPVVLKASAGGGGRGIRMIDAPEDLPYAFASARTEAEHGFGDPTVFLEQRVGAARHVEVQAIADNYGTVWAVGVRDCSVQRRNQKVLEESASTALDAETETAIKDAAVRLCQAAGYRNAGTVEFLYDPSTRRYLFMEVNTRLQVEHPATELVTGLDLVKLQLHVAEGGRLEGSPPRPAGHAIEARLNAEDPEQSFSPAPGRIVAWRPPTGPGVRVETGVTDGDTIAPEFDSMIAKILAWGRDREEALARLRRALTEALVIVEGGMTNKAFLLGLLDRPEIQAGNVDTAWLDRLTAAGEHLPRHRGVALLYAAIEAYEADRAAAQVAFYQGAARGRPDLPAETGYGVDLRFRGEAYHFDVYCTGPGTYRVHAGDGAVVVRVVEQGTFERRVTIGGQDHRVVAHTEGPSFQVESNGVQHRISRDEGGLVRADAPALVVAVKVEPEQEVAPGDPLIVLESMKMERTLTAPFGGRVRAVLVGTHVQVDPGTPLLQIDPDAGEQEQPGGTRLRFDDLPSIAEPATADERRARLFAELRSYLLGYDLDPAGVRGIPAAMTTTARTLPPGDPALLADEREILEIFAEVGGLFRRHPTPESDEPGELLESTQEHLLIYLAWLDAERSGVPQRFLDRLTRALLRYGVQGLEYSPDLLAALFWMYRSFVRIEEVAPVVAAILDRHAHALKALDLDVGYRELLDRVVATAEGRHQEVSDLAREVRFRAFDQPVMDRARNEVYADMQRLLDELDRGPEAARREELVQRLVWCHQPLRALLRDRYRGGDERMRDLALEINTRRFYRIRRLQDVHTVRLGDQLLGIADYSHDGKDVHLVTAYCDLDELDAVLTAVRSHLDEIDNTRLVVVGLATWRAGSKPDDDTMVALARQRLQEAWDDGPPLHRADVTITSTGDSPEHERTQHASFRHVDGRFEEEPLFRNLHPMMAKRLELWRLDNFHVVRQASAEDVFVFHATARGNPEDQRLFALAEVRDLTPIKDDAGRIVALPHMERMVMEALTAIRHAQGGRPARRRLLMNRIILNVRPPWEVPPELWRELSHRIAPATSGLGLEKVVVTVQVPDRASGELRPAVLHVENIAVRGVTVRLEPPGMEPVRELSAYGQKVLKSRRIGAPYPYELVRMLTPASGTTSDFPSGDFVEHDLDDEHGDRLVPVQRPYGENRAGVVVGVIRNVTTKVPEGMRRVFVAGDPSRSLGSLAEAECRRINAAIDLAQELGVPVEWFALSSGARISMDSGTENMDWIGAVLRRIIEFTQAGGEINVVVTGINVGAQPYWNAEATMLMHTRGILVMTPQSAMVLTGKQSLDFSGGVSAEDNYGIGGYERIMGPNGQAQYWAANVEDACTTLFRYYDHTYVVPGERFPRRAASSDDAARDVREAPHPALDGTPFTRVGDVFSDEANSERKHAFDIRSVLRSVSDSDHQPLERWSRWRNAEMAVVWDAHVGGFPVSLIGIESHNMPRKGFVPADGPPNWTSGTLFPQASRKIARAINAASGNRPVVVLANLSGFDGSPESMRKLQLEFGAEIGRAVTNFDGPIVFTVVSRYHGGAFVVFAKTLNDGLEIAAVEGSFASVIGGAPAAGVVFAREVRTRTERDPRIAELRAALAASAGDGVSADHSRLDELRRQVHAETLARVAGEFDSVHSIQRALRVGSVDRIIAARELRPYVIDAVARGVARASGASQRIPTG